MKTAYVEIYPKMVSISLYNGANLEVKIDATRDATLYIKDLALSGYNIKFMSELKITPFDGDIKRTI